MAKATFFERLVKSIESQGMMLLRISLGIIYFWFGLLKFFDDASAAESIASRTVSWLTFGHLTSEVSMPLLATLECLIGIGILIKKNMRFVIPLLYFQMIGTLLPLFIFPDETWKYFPIVPTLEGQYIIKNLILVSAGIVLGAISKGGKLIQDPEVADKAKKAETQKDSQ